MPFFLLQSSFFKSTLSIHHCNILFIFIKVYFLKYKIKDENTDGDKATVDVEVEVYDYRSALDKAETYRDENKDEFLDDDKKEDSSKYMDYKIAELKKVSDKRKYTITFNLHKEDDEWVLDDISDSDREKLHGLYLE